MARPALDILCDLIKQENPDSLIQPSYVTVGTGYPKTVNYQGKDTQTILVAKKGTPLIGNISFYYNRIKLDVHTAGKTLAVPAGTYYKVSTDLIPLVLAQFSVQLTADDIIYENITADANGQFKLRIASKSLMYSGYILSGVPGASLYSGASVKYLDGFYKP
jgi:hypothetical protein